MPRHLIDLQSGPPDGETTTRDLSLTRKTARSFAAAVSVLLIATLVVNRTGTALSGDAASSNAAITSGTIELTDDDEGRSLFDLRDLTPARPVERCVEVTYGGTILPVALAVSAEASGELAEYLDVSIEEGLGGDFESCAGFLRSAPVYGGSLDDLTTLGWIGLGDVLNTGESRTYRIELTVQDRQEALGQATSLEFAWEVTPS